METKHQCKSKSVTNSLLTLSYHWLEIILVISLIHNIKRMPPSFLLKTKMETSPSATQHHQWTSKPCCNKIIITMKKSAHPTSDLFDQSRILFQVRLKPISIYTNLTVECHLILILPRFKRNLGQIQRIQKRKEKVKNKPTLIAKMNITTNKKNIWRITKQPALSHKTANILRGRPKQLKTANMTSQTFWLIIVEIKINIERSMKTELISSRDLEHLVAVKWQ